MTRILIVDDDSDESQVIAWSLKDYQTEIRQVTTVQEALEAIDRETPDVILLDINLGSTRDDGFELLIKRRKSPVLSTIPVIMCSGNGDQGRIAKARTLGANGYLIKQVDFKSVLKALKKINIPLQEKPI